MTAGSFTGAAFKVPELYAGKLARTVLRGRKLPGCPSKEAAHIKLFYLKVILFGNFDNVKYI